MYFGSARFLRSSSSVAELSRCGQPGQKVGVRATTFFVEHCQLGLAGLAEAIQFGWSAGHCAIAAGFRSVAWISGMSFCASTE